jgi:hypothetical protein
MFDATLQQDRNSLQKTVCNICHNFGIYYFASKQSIPPSGLSSKSQTEQHCINYCHPPPPPARYAPYYSQHLNFVHLVGCDIKFERMQICTVEIHTAVCLSVIELLLVATSIFFFHVSNTSRHSAPRDSASRHSAPRDSDSRHSAPRDSASALHVTAPDVTALHVTALHVTALHVTARHVTAPHVTALHITAPHVTALHVTALHVTAPHVTALHVTLYSQLYVTQPKLHVLSRS